MTETDVRLAHTIADAEASRTRSLRCLTDQRDMLLLALHAIREGNYAVADEFVDRAAFAISREVVNLKAEVR